MTQNPLEKPDHYELLQISPNVFVYRNTGNAATGIKAGEEEQYLCQPCFDAGVQSVLSREESAVAINHACLRCKAVFLERKKPLTGLAMSPWG
jgi:hypothetical protein